MHPPLPSQTIPVPQVVPADLLPKSRHTGDPVWQLTMPVLHAVGFVVQFAFAVQAPHVPAALQTMLVPQLVPAGLLASSAQVWAPVAHEVVPVLQAPGLVAHGCPLAQAPHTPAPSQTMPTPQLMPAVRFGPSTQVVGPLAQLVIPCLHAVGLPVHVWPATQAPQNPLPSHIGPPGQVAVAGLGVPSMQVDAPVVHDVTPFRQIDGFVVQASPPVHDTHSPVPLQTRLVPQVVPAAVLPESRHLGAPVAQSITPVLQGAPGLVVHALPASHITHWPLPLQTVFEPQDVPPETLSPSTQPDDIPHCTTPSLQAPPGLVVQTVPAAQVVHAPALQTRSVPQNVPSAALAPLRHWGAPLVHAIAPFWHGLPGLVVHTAPVAQGMHVPAALQTWSAPQLAPGLFAVPFMHPTGSHTMVPLRH